MVLTKSQLKGLIKEIIEESRIVEEAKIKVGDEMYEQLNAFGKLLKAKERAEDEVKRIGAEIKAMEKPIKQFVATLDDKIAETNRVMVKLEEIGAKLSQTPKYQKMAETLYEELKGNLDGFKTFAEEFKELTAAKIVMSSEVKRGRPAADDVVEEGILDGLKTLAKGAVDAILGKIKSVINLFKKNETTLEKANAFLKEAAPVAKAKK